MANMLWSLLFYNLIKLYKQIWIVKKYFFTKNLNIYNIKILIFQNNFLFKWNILIFLICCLDFGTVLCIFCDIVYRSFLHKMLKLHHPGR